MRAVGEDRPAPPGDARPQRRGRAGRGAGDRHHPQHRCKQGQGRGLGGPAHRFSGLRAAGMMPGKWGAVQPRPDRRRTEWTGVTDLTHQRWYFRTFEDRSIDMVDRKATVAAAGGKIVRSSDGFEAAHRRRLGRGAAAMVAVVGVSLPGASERQRPALAPAPARLYQRGHDRCTAKEHPQLLDHRPHRSRQVDPRRPADPDDRRRWPRAR